MSVNDAPPPSAFELRKLRLEERKLALDRAKLKLERDKVRQDLANHRSTTTNGYSFNAARAALILNGGSAAAFLAFLGAVVRSSVGRVDIEKAANALVWLALGAVLSAVALMLGYLTRISYNEDNLRLPRKRWFTIYLEIASVCPGVFSILVYIYALTQIAPSFRAAAAGIKAEAQATTAPIVKPAPAPAPPPTAPVPSPPTRAP